MVRLRHVDVRYSVNRKAAAIGSLRYFGLRLVKTGLFDEFCAVFWLVHVDVNMSVWMFDVGKFEA